MRYVNKVLLGLLLSVFMCASIVSAQMNLDEIPIFGPDDTLEDIRDKIEENGFQFTVDNNWVYDMSREEKDILFSRRPSAGSVEPAGDLGPLEKHLGLDVLPDSFDWRSHNGHSYIGSIRNQGSCGSCYAFGANAAAEGTYNVANGLVDGNCVDFSESFII